MAVLSDYSFGRVTIDGEQVTADVIVLPGRVVHGWRRADGHALVRSDLADVIEELPESVLVGTGNWGAMKVDPALVQELSERGVTLEAYRTSEAVDRYAASDSSRTAIALHLTC